MSGSDDTAAVVARARTGEPKACEVLVRRYLRAAYAVALGVLGSAEDAQDVAQDAFLVAFARIHTCREAGQFAGWLLQIVRNRAHNVAKARRVRSQSLPPSKTHEAPATERLQLRDSLLKALALVTEEQREVVLLHDLHDWTHAEIACALGISEVMSRQHLFIARRTIRGHLRTTGHEESCDER